MKKGKIKKNVIEEGISRISTNVIIRYGEDDIGGHKTVREAWHTIQLVTFVWDSILLVWIATQPVSRLNVPIIDDLFLSGTTLCPTL